MSKYWIYIGNGIFITGEIQYTRKTEDFYTIGLPGAAICLTGTAGDEAEYVLKAMAKDYGWWEGCDE